MIQINRLSKSFDAKLVLDDIDLTIGDREQVVVLGRSGSGKTVLLKCLIGLVRPDRGEISVDGTDIVRARSGSLFRTRRRMGFVFQASALLDSLTIAGNIALALQDRKLGRAELRQTVEETLALVGLDPRMARQYPQELSGGQKKLVAIARAIARAPRYLLYDEPSTGLDPHVRDQIIALIRDLAQKFSTTSVIVTHDLVLARKTGTRLLFLKAGRLETPERIDAIEDFYE